MSEVIHPCPVALDKLKKGNAEHVKRSKNPIERTSIQTVVKDPGQTPYAAILSCADSRVIPENIFTANEGDLFVVRVAGNIANTSSIASLEYAIKYLHVRVIVVLGHESCGAVDAAIKQAKDRINFESNLNNLLSHIIPAINDPTINDLKAAVKKNAELTSEQLLAKSEILSHYYNNEGLSIFHGYYNIYGKEPGKVDSIDSWSCGEAT